MWKNLGLCSFSTLQKYEKSDLCGLVAFFHLFIAVVCTDQKVSSIVLETFLIDCFQSSRVQNSLALMDFNLFRIPNHLKPCIVFKKSCKIRGTSYIQTTTLIISQVLILKPTILEIYPFFILFAILSLDFLTLGVL